MRKTKSSVAQEIRQKRPFPSAAAEAGVALLRTADLVKRHFTALAAPLDLTLPQYNVLRILRGAEPDGLPTLEIRERMIEREPGITRLLDRLEAKGLVDRKRCPTDRRRVDCRITAAGLELVTRLDAPVDAADRAAMSGLSPKEIAILVDLLDRIRDTVRQELDSVALDERSTS